eukprot:m.8525 g.8525  ORF g.8525 m.8525 type:complete len:637 (+) comp5240_c0_seq1:233-2143(+)
MGCCQSQQAGARAVAQSSTISLPAPVPRDDQVKSARALGAVEKNGRYLSPGDLADIANAASASPAPSPQPPIPPPRPSINGAPSASVGEKSVGNRPPRVPLVDIVQVSRPRTSRRRSERFPSSPTDDNPTSAGHFPSVSDALLELDKRTTGKPITLKIAPVDVAGFLALPLRITHAEELPAAVRGKNYNRYTNILPNPLTQVRLPMIRSDPNTEYVNANYVHGFDGLRAREYIAAQAPTKNNLGAFVRMMWESGAVAIVMLTGFVEMGRPKCEPYYPIAKLGETQVEHDGIVVVLEEQREQGAWVESSLLLKSGRETRRLTHFWFRAWPDHEAPVDAEGVLQAGDLLKLVLRVLEYRRDRDECDAPLIVHCSAGVGRSGTYIAIDQGVRLLEAFKPVDMVSIVAGLREDRMSMVQHSLQYKFAIQACLLYARHYHPFAARGVTIKWTVPHGSASEALLLSDTAWVLHNRAAQETVFELPDTTPALRRDARDRSAEGPDNAAPIAPKGTASPEVRRRLSCEPLTTQPWFRTGLTRPQVDELLHDAPEGMFVVRESRERGCYALSVVHHKNIAHMLIVPIGKQYRLGRTDTDQPLFDTIPALVQHYVSNPYAFNSVTGEQYRLLDRGFARMLSNESVV